MIAGAALFEVGRAHARRDRAEPAGRVGAPAAAARVVGQERARATRRTSSVDRQRQQRVEDDREQDLADEQQRDRRVDAEQELHDREADRVDAGARSRRRRPGRGRAPGRAARAGGPRRSRPRSAPARRSRASAAARCRRTGRSRSRTARPATEPISRPTAATSSGERSAGTPKTVIWATAVSCRMPPSRPRAARRPTSGRGRGHGVGSRSRRAGRWPAWSAPRRTRAGAGRRRAGRGCGGRARPRPRRRGARCRSGCPGGNSDFSRVETVPAVTIRSPSLTSLPRGDELEQQVAGRADRGVERRRARRSAAALAETPNSWSVSSITIALPSETRLDLADQALAVDHGLVGAHAVARALVDLHGRVPGARGAREDARDHRLVGLHAAGGVDVEQRRAAACSRRRRPASWVTSWRSASRSFLSLSRSSLASSVDAEPAEEVAERLDDAVRALLDRREHLHRAALDAVQTA